MFSHSKQYIDDIKYINNFNLEWDKINNKSFLITGAAGLIGTAIVDALVWRNRNYGANIKIFALVRPKKPDEKRFRNYISDDNFAIIAQDIIEPIVKVNERVDYIIHLASNTHPILYSNQPIQTINTIVKGMENILDFAVRMGSKVINVSSVEIYGENQGDTDRFKEDYCGYINCNTLRAGYPEAKRLAEAMSQAYIKEKGANVVTARLSRVYGPTILLSDTKSATQFIKDAVQENDIVLKSDGKQQYSFVYVADTVTALLTLLANGKNGEAYNVASDEVKTLHEIADYLAGINNRKVIFDFPSEKEKAGFSVVTKALMNSDHIKRINWFAKYNLENGLSRTVEILKEGLKK